MSNQKPTNSYEIVVGPKIKVTQDKKSKAQIVNFPFEFPSGDRGVLIVCRLVDEEWTMPAADIHSIIINFNE